MGWREKGGGRKEKTDSLGGRGQTRGRGERRKTPTDRETIVLISLLFSLHSPLRLHHPGTRNSSLPSPLSFHVLLHLLFPISLICCLSLTVPVSALTRLLPFQAAEFLEPGWEERWGLCWGRYQAPPHPGKDQKPGPALLRCPRPVPLPAKLIPHICPCPVQASSGLQAAWCSVRPALRLHPGRASATDLTWPPPTSTSLSLGFQSCGPATWDFLVPTSLAPSHPPAFAPAFALAWNDLPLVVFWASSHRPSKPSLGHSVGEAFLVCPLPEMSFLLGPPLLFCA